ncbi:DUF1553 domain-containing protein [Leadbetterella sp. DM7]|uniref:DUF1553 domain-containing protein n=1 Tax=Leadbetterella sp. DM7 TaxID=3235085 RepID=UPI00349EE386
MKANLLKFIVSALCSLGIFLTGCTGSGEKVDYITQVKPILNKHCISCHGGVKMQSNYSLLYREEALGKGKSGKYGIIPGNASGSEFIRRLTLHDPEERMPYQKDPLSEEEIGLLTKWIDQGAEWGNHWAYEPVKKPAVPSVKGSWAKTDIDRFILHEAQKQGLKPSAQAPDEVLLRRAALDVIGLPAPDNLKAEYAKNKNYTAYVDQLLAMPAYGEKWTSMWLDLARYADTKGYERDGRRNIWRYRDWLIRAFNTDMPYDRFLTEQLAGDLLPNATEDQLIATAFHRNTMTNDEGGTNNEEFRTEAVIDRVNTTWETLMSTTFACVQCHSHPYDQFRHEEYYKFMAFFNNSRDEDTYADYPVFRHYDSTGRQKLQALSGWLREKVSPQQQNELMMFLKTLQPSYNSIVFDEFVNAELADTKWLALRNHSSARLQNVNLSGKNLLMIRLSYPTDGRLELRLDSPKGPVVGQLQVKESSRGWQLMEIPLKRTEGRHNLYTVYASPRLKDPNATGMMFDWLHFMEDLPQGNDAESRNYAAVFRDLLNADVEQTPVMIENPGDFARKTHLFERGSWLSPGKEVTPGVPALLGGLKPGQPRNRLGLAQWMTSDKNPLVARTMVNRVWEQIFGQGLVETLEDFGSQGAAPVNRELLDYLSYQFMHEYGWSVKKLIRAILVSETYRQSSEVNPEKLEKDPFNRYLARGPRVRLSAEQIRDQALAVSGALNTRMYGPPVMPYQPDGIWNSPYNSDRWKMSEDGQQYRRAVYTFMKRTSPYPSMVTFDATGRDICLSRRIRTNTPLQALVTLNDSAFVDLAVHLARRVQAAGVPEKSIEMAYKAATGRSLSAEKRKVLLDLYQQAHAAYQKDPALCKALAGGTDARFAALVLVANSILNLDEVITKT